MVAVERDRYVVRTGGTSGRLRRLGRSDIPIVNPPIGSNSDWSETNQPWAYGTDTNKFTSKWPSGVTIVDIQTGSSDFYTNLQNTVNAAGGRVVVRLSQAVYHLNSFIPIGSSGDVTYAFGFWFPNLRGFLGQGADKTIIQMDANSISSAQLSRMATMTVASFSPLQMGFCRIDGTSSSPFLVAGVCFRAADQQNLTSKSSDLPVFVPQPAPHQGVTFYANGDLTGLVSYCRFQAAGRALNSQPPFEMANVTTQNGNIEYDHCEFDGRRASDLDPARPRRCGPWMGNGETVALHEDCYFHHTNVSRYAANDQNRNFQGQYSLIRCKFEQITNVQNKDPALNGGATLGGYTNATPAGWESCNGTITVTDCIISQDNPFADAQVAQHLQLTSVGSRDPQGGRLYVHGGEFRNTAWTQVNDYVGFRISAATYWKRDGYNNTLFIYHRDGQRLSPYIYTGTWPPSTATLTAAGVSPSTHFIIREA